VASLARIEAAIAEGERAASRTGSVRGRARAPARAGAAALSRRANGARGVRTAAVWDTAENCGVLVYLLLADRDVEIVADRGIHANVGNAAWAAICRKMETAFRAGRYGEGVEAGIVEINALLALHYPREGRGRNNELPDQPGIL
jgi:uncharacterized membrane protein